MIGNGNFRVIQKNLIISLGLLIIIFISSILFYHYSEKWDYLDSIYFVTMSLTTVGYGDLVPKSDMGKIFTIFLIWTGVSIAFFFIYSLAAYRQVMIEKTLNIHILERLKALRHIGMKKLEKDKEISSIKNNIKNKKRAKRKKRG